MLKLCGAVLLLAGEVSAANANGCYADWSVAAPIVRRQGLATVEALAKLAKTNIAGNIVKTTLCEEENRFVYRLLIRDANGRLLNQTVDARAPFRR